MKPAYRHAFTRAIQLLSLMLILLLTACQPGQPTQPANATTQTSVDSVDPSQTQDPNAQPTIDFDNIVEVTGPTLIPIPDTIEWSRDPSAIVFRAEITSGSTGDTPETAYIRNEIPPCTIYGDNRIVWTTTSIRTDDVVVFDILTDEAIRTFVGHLIQERNFYGFMNTLEATPEPNSETPVVERLTLTINGESYVTDSFSGWGYTYFGDVLADCRSISTTPIAFEPQGAWVTVRDMGYDANHVTLYWDPATNGFALADLANGTAQWMTGAPMLLLWQTVRSGGIDTLLQENGTDYLVTVEVPGITRSSPPAPSS